MITLHGTSPDGKKLLLIGIADGQIALLKDQGGMRVVTPEGMIVDMMYAPTEKELIEQMTAAGFITDKTEVAVETAPFKPEGAKILKLDSRIVPPPANGSNN